MTADLSPAEAETLARFEAAADAEESYRTLAADIVRQWVGEVAFRPDDFVLGHTGLTADQLPDLHRLLDALAPDWRYHTDAVKRELRGTR